MEIIGQLKTKILEQDIWVKAQIQQIKKNGKGFLSH